MAVVANFLEGKLVVRNPQVATKDAGVPGKMVRKKRVSLSPASEAGQ
jgi:hypothetical protein